MEKLRVPLVSIQQLAEHLATQDDFESWHEPETGILCFQHQPDHIADLDRNDLQTYIYESILSEGRRSISITQLDDAVVLRILVMSSRIEFADLLETIDDIRSSARNFGSKP